jgi:hypothetical protein
MRSYFYIFHIIFFLECLPCTSIKPISSFDCMYPVSEQTSDGEMFFLHQDKYHHNTLFRVNLKRESATQELFSLYSPTQVHTLPDQSGFSFVDNDIIFVKSDKKRSPRVIDLEEPLYNINSVAWISAQEGVCCAKQGDSYGVFLFNVEGRVKIVAKADGRDYLAPCVSGSDCYFIGHATERDGRESCTLWKKALSHPVSEEKPESCVAELGSGEMYALRVYGSYAYYLTGSVDVATGFCAMSYKRVDLSDGKRETLFGYSVPLSFLFSESDFLNELWVPFVPFHLGNLIYYSTFENYCGHSCNGHFLEDRLSSSIVGFDVTNRVATVIRRFDGAVTLAIRQFDDLLVFGYVRCEPAMSVFCCDVVGQVRCGGMQIPTIGFEQVPEEERRKVRKKLRWQEGKP